MAKLKSGNVIVRLLLAHGEKIGILAILICAGMLVYSATGLERLADDRKPGDLEQMTSSARQTIDNTKWEDVDPNQKIIAAPPSETMADVDPLHFPVLDYSLDRPPLNPTKLRLDPALLVVEDLEVYGDSGLWAYAHPDVIEQNRLKAMEEADEKAAAEAAKADDDEGDSRLFGREGREGRVGAGRFGGERTNPRGRGRGRGEEDDRKPRKREGPVVLTSSGRSQLQGFEEIQAQSWVTVVGRVPIKKQFELYQEALEEASGYVPDRDVPRYRGCYIERAEVTAAGTGEWTQIAILNEKGLLKKTESYPPLGTQPIVPSQYTHPILTHPLPPLILRDWDRRVTHSSIPTIEEESEAAMDDPVRQQYEKEVEEAIEGDDFARQDSEEEGFNSRLSDRVRMPRNSRSEIAGRGRGRGRPRGEYGGGREFGGPASMYGGAASMYGGRGGMRGLEGGGRRSGLGEFMWDQDTSHILFRYFDSDVRPGGRYRYRVRLAVTDVNAKVSEQSLDKTVNERLKKEKKKGWRLTEWSQPSPIASVPLPARVYVAGVDAVKEREGVYDSEPEAKMLVKVFDYQLPGELAREVESLRGTVLNQLEKASVIWTQATRGSSDEDGKEFEKEYLFRTGITVLDMRGGQMLTRRRSELFRPARVLMMDPSGRLFVQEELDDTEATDEFKTALEGGGDGRGFGRGIEGAGGYGGPYGGGGFGREF